MKAIPKAQLILGYKEFFNEEPPENRLQLLNGICKRSVLAEIAGLNYRLKPYDTKYSDTSLRTQASELQYFCAIDKSMHDKYWRLASSYTKNAEEYPLIFTRQTCLYAIEEIIQSDLPIIENFEMAKRDVWESILVYLLSVNSVITEIKEAEDEQINFETLNPKLLPLNELSLDSDPIYTGYRGYHLLRFLSENELLKHPLNEYLSLEYDLTFEEFILNIMGMYLSNHQPNKSFNFHYKVLDADLKAFRKLSSKYKSDEFQKLLSIRKYPFYVARPNTFFLLDNVLLLEKTYNQFINDFWFDKVKQIPGGDIDIKRYKSVIGYFFEHYSKHVIEYAFQNAKFFVIKLFSDLKVNFRGGQYEVADLFIRKNSKVLLGQVKATSIYDSEKYGFSVDKLYKNDRSAFFASFGVDQLVNSIKLLEEGIGEVDPRFPKGKSYQIYPIIIVNEKVLQTALMPQLFNERFSELLQEVELSRKIHVYPLTVVHISDLETLQDTLHTKPDFIWDLLKYHYRNPKFIPPFFNSINRKDIRPNYSRCHKLFEHLIQKFNQVVDKGN